MSEYKRVSGKLRRVDLTEYHGSLEEWARDYLLRNNELSKAEDCCKEWNECLLYYVKENNNKFIFIHGVPFEIISKVDHEYPTEFSEVKDNSDGTFDFHCCWYNGGAGLEEVVESGFDRYAEEHKE